MFRNDFLNFILFGFFAVVHFGTRCTADYAATFNIDTLTAQHIIRPPLQLKLALFDPVTLFNGGKGIDLYLNPFSKRNYIAGGPLQPGTVFIAYNVRYNFNASIFGTSGLTFDKVGTPITVDSYWYNAKYGSAALASSFADGVAIVRQPVKICTSNPSFPAFQAALNQIQTDGSSTRTQNGIAVGWSISLVNIADYYTYAGLYASTINDTPIKYNVATVIVLPLKYAASISPVQFTSFQQLFAKGQSFTQSSAEFFKQIDVPAYCVNGPVVFTLTP